MVELVANGEAILVRSRQHTLARRYEAFVAYARLMQCAS